MEPRYEVLCSNGDRCEALTADAALTGAKQMYEDHLSACEVIGRGNNLTFTFLVDGKATRTLTGKAVRRLA